MTSFTREINRLLLAILGTLSLIFLAAAYYALVASVTLLQREDNPRLVEAERSIMRGTIYDRNDIELAYSTPDENGFAIRHYTEPSTYSAIGYYSYRYGSSGVETAFNEQLIGQNIPASLAEYFLKEPERGEDIQLTLDLAIQQAVVNAMGDHHGAVIVMAVPSGDVLALASLPTFNPNTLDEDWSTLTQDEGNPFFNRALQGRYQPGSMMNTVLIISALVKGQPLNAQFLNGSAPVSLDDDLTLTCVAEPPSRELTLRQAYLYGCPTPFKQIAPIIGLEDLRNAITTLRLENPPTLAGFFPDEDGALPTRITRLNFEKNALGQGEITVSPMSFTTLTAALINDGNTPRPRIIQATRLPGTSDWIPFTRNAPTVAYTTASTARRMAELMRNSVTEGNASYTNWGDMDVGGQTGMAYSGEGTHVWFTGFAVFETEQNVVVTVVLENENDPNEAANIANSILSAAHESLTSIQHGAVE